MRIQTFGKVNREQKTGFAAHMAYLLIVATIAITGLMPIQSWLTG